MILLLIFSFLAFQPDSYLCAIPAPDKSGYTLNRKMDELTASRKGFTISMRFLSHGEFGLYCSERGIPKSLVNDSDIAAVLKTWIFVEVTLVNRGLESVHLNPGHIEIREGEVPRGVFVDPGYIMMILEGGSSEKILTLAQALNPAALEIPPQSQEQRVIVFRPTRDMFPTQSLDICLDHLYVGVEDHSLKGRFTLQPCRTP